MISISIEVLIEPMKLEETIVYLVFWEGAVGTPKMTPVSLSITRRIQSEMQDSWKAIENTIEEEQPLQGDFAALLHENMSAMKLK